MNTFLEQNKLRSRIFILCLGFVLSPYIAFGAFNPTYIKDVVGTITWGVNAFIPIMIGLTFIYFAYCMIQYIRSEGEDKGKNKASLVWSVIAVALVVSIWGIVGLLQSIFGAQNNNITLPTVPGTGSASGVPFQTTD